MQSAGSSILPLLLGNEEASTKVTRRPGLGTPTLSLQSSMRWPNVPGYELLSVIGSGGMGIVYKARHRDLQRTVALKMLRGVVLDDPEFHARFQAEAETVARLQHPNIIQVFEVGSIPPLEDELNPSPFISLEFVDGGSLTRLTYYPMQPRQAAEMVEKLARAVYSAHRLGVIHRDLKPDNVLLTREDEPKIADFGVAKQMGTERDARGRCVTQAGTVIGTPEYMAPEQAAGESPTPAVDIYALGVILYELLTAHVPFQGATPSEIVTQKKQPPVSPRRHQPSLPRDLETICLKCLERQAYKRYNSALALADDLRRYLDGRTILARRVSETEKAIRWCRRNPLVAASLAGVVGTFLVAFLLVSRSYWRAEVAFQKEAHQRQEAERKEKAERWERYRANLVATASAVQLNNVGNARRSLEDAPVEYRNWEWQHYQSRLDLAQRVLSSDDANITAAQIAPAGNRAVLFGDDGFVRIWDLAEYKELRTVYKRPEMWGGILSPDGKVIAYAASNHEIRMWDSETDRVLTVLHGHEDHPFTFQFSADGTRFVSGSAAQVCVWDAITGRLLRFFKPYESAMQGMRISPDGRLAVTCDRGSSNIYLWNLETGNKIATLRGHEFALLGVVFDPKCERVITIERFPCNVLRMWNAKTGQLLREMDRDSNALTDVKFSSDGTRVAASSRDQTVRLWDGLTGQPIATMKGHNGQANCVVFSPNGKLLVSGSEDHTVRLWDAVNGASLAVLNGHTASVLALAFSGDSSRILSASRDGTLRVWDAGMADYNGILKGHTKFVYSVAFHPDGKRVASAGWDGTARIWDVTTGQQKMLFDHGKDLEQRQSTVVSSVAIHPAGLILATRTREAIFLWDIATGRKLHQWNSPSDSWRDSRVAFSPDGSLLATGCQGKIVRIWDVESRAEVAALAGHNDEIRDVAFSPDSRLLASAGEDGDRTIRIWDVANKVQIHSLEGHKSRVYSLAFSPDGNWLSSGSTDGTVRLWNAKTWQETAVLKHGANVYSVAFTPDSKRLASGCSDNSIRFWDVATHQSVAEFRGHSDYVHSIAFSPDGTRLLSGSGDFNLRIWDTVRPQDRIDGQSVWASK